MVKVNCNLNNIFNDIYYLLVSRRLIRGGGGSPCFFVMLVFEI